MAWPMPPGGHWNSMPVAPGPDNMNMGSYTPEQWSMMQQQTWQWAQWQQQYAQWQSQYGEKYNQQLQSMQTIGMAPPLPPSNMPPPAPPPPDKPPPPPHENDEPLFGTPKGPAPVPPPNTNPVSINHQSNSDRLSSNPKISNTEENESQQGVNTEALKKLAEEERIFDIQFKKWEEEIEKWKEENVNHPDKQAYSEYEQKFETCRAQLLERRLQMNQKRAKLLNTAPQPINNKNTGNICTTVPPPQQYNKSKNYSINVPPVQQSYKDSCGPYSNNRNMSQSHPYNMAQYNYNEDDRNMERNNSNQHYDDNEEQYGNIDTENSFLSLCGSAKGIPGLDLVPEERISSNHKDVIDITGDQNDVPPSNAYVQQNPNSYQRAQPNSAPDYSTISQGINNILGDEKIMNILSMVAGQQSNRGNNQSGNVTFNVNTAPPQLMQPANNQWSKDDNHYNARFNNRQPIDFNNQNLNYPPPEQNQFNNPPPIQTNYDNRQGTPSEKYYDNNSQRNQYGNQNVNTRNIVPPLMQVNTQMSRSLMQSNPQEQPESQLVGQNRRGMYENREPMHPNMDDRRGMQAYEESQTSNLSKFNARGLLDKNKPILPTNAHIVPEQRVHEQRASVMPPMKPAWDRDPLFTPSIIVEYDHNALRLKARDFIEPVHTFDYNHVSKDGEGYKRKFNEEMDQFITTLPRKSDVDKDWSHDRHVREMNYRDSRQSRHNIKNDDYIGRCDNFYQRRFDDRRYEERDRNTRHEDPYREKEYDRTRDRERNSEKDSDRNRDLGRSGRDREYVREKDFERDRDLVRDKIYGRDREVYRGREDKDRDNGRDRERDHARDKYRDRRSDRNRSHSRDRDNRKRGASKEIDSNNLELKKMKPGSFHTAGDSDVSTKPTHIVMIDDILESPGREIRPKKIVIVLRGPPGSGKSYLAKLIRDREAEQGGAARIMSIDDYFMQEGEIEEKDPTTGKIVKKPSLKYEYDENFEESYMNSLKRAFKRSITDGYYSFLIYDAVNDQLKGYADIWNYARQNGFQVYICTMELDPQVCFKRNIHNRKMEDIAVICSRFFPTPAHHIQLDATTLLQSASIPEVHMEDVSNDDIVDMAIDEEPEVENSFTSKWEKMDDANQLARLDGINKPLRPSQLSMEDYLQLDDWKPNTAKPGKKTVRWADLEERRKQEKMRAIGFVVGQTDWNRMTDPTRGSSALTQTKYIERVRRH